MIIENSFEVPIAPDRALAVLTDVPAIAPCIPGVQLTEDLGDGAYRGTASVRLGPVALSFGGEARIAEIDREARTARVEAEGADQKGRGRARATVTFTLAPSGEGARVDVRSDVTLSGQVAQYGRASGLIKSVANEIIADFARNLESKLKADGVGQAPIHADAPAAGETKPQSGTGTKPAASPAKTSASNEISGLGLLWRAIRSMLVGLFSRGGRG
jgi:uncharacterized protein